jgi:hypothetical protein
MSKRTKNRYVYVISSGWMWGGDATVENGRVLLRRAVHFFGFKELGFTAAVEQWKDKRVDVRPSKEDIDFPAHCELFRVHVDDDWGLK